MVTRVQFTHLIQCDVETFWRDFLDDDFNRELFVSELGYPAYRVLERKVDGPRVWRRIEMTPLLRLPAAVTKIVGNKLSFVEVGDFDGALYRFSFGPPAGFGADVAVSAGSIRTEPAAHGATQRTVELGCEIRMFGVGRMLESAAVKAARDAYDEHAKALNRLLAKRG